MFKKNNEYEIEIEYIGNIKEKDDIFDKLIYNVGILISLYQDSYYIVSQEKYNKIMKLYNSISGTEKFIASNRNIQKISKSKAINIQQKLISDYI